MDDVRSEKLEWFERIARLTGCKKRILIRNCVGFACSMHRI